MVSTLSSLFFPFSPHFPIFKTHLSGQLGRFTHNGGEEAVYKPGVVEIPEQSCIKSIDCGPCTSAAVSTWGEGFIWGRLADEKFCEHQPTPRSINHLFHPKSWISKITCGGFHYLVLTDPTATKLFSKLSKMCKNDLSRDNCVELVHLFSELPSDRIKQAQDRAIHRICSAWKEELARIEMDTNAIKFHLNRNQTQTMKFTSLRSTITITNNGNNSCLINIDVPKQVQSSKFTFHFEPNNFELGKKKSTKILVLLKTFKASEELSTLFTVEAINLSKTNNNTPQFLQQSREKTVHYVYTETRFPPEVNNKTLFDSTKRFSAKNVTHLNFNFLKILSSYVPISVLRHVAVNKKPLFAPLHESFLASILFIDISGFTSLNEKLARLGGRGIEQVSKHLNSYFGKLIDVVYAHGGDILKFAGDALICMFSPNEEEGEPSQEQLAMRSIQCAFQIQSKLAVYDSNEGFTLSLHIGISCGKVSLLHCGGVDGSWEVVFAGEPFTQLKTAVDSSKSGEVVVSKETWKVVEPFCEAIHKKSDDFCIKKIVKAFPQQKNAQIPQIPFDCQSALKCYIPPVLLNRLEALMIGWLGELRQVSVLFVNLTGLSFSEEHGLDTNTIHQALCTMQTVIFKYEGIVRQFLVDGSISLPSKFPFHQNFSHHIKISLPSKFPFHQNFPSIKISPIISKFLFFQKHYAIS